MKPTRILIVEDELVIALDIKRQCEKLGYEIGSLATSVAEAQACLKKHEIDLVLLDIRLSDEVPGTELAKQLRASGDIPFIYITSHYDKTTVAEAKTTRPNGYLIKPFSKEDIYVAVEMAQFNFAHKALEESEPLDTNVAAPAKLKKVVSYIHENLDRKLTLPELAALTDWNMYHFARMFKKYLHEPPYQYLQKARIEKAKLLIQDETLSVSQVALELGFENHSHFSQTFRKRVGLSPDAYRKSLNKKVASE